MIPNDKIKFDSTQNEYYIAKDYKQIYVDEFTNTPGKELNLYVKHHTKGVILIQGLYFTVYPLVENLLCE